MSNQLTPFEAAKQPETIASLLNQEKYKKRFEQVLGERAPQFISSILSLGTTLHDVEPRSVLAGAAIAASLNLPINPTLGFAWIVPYKKNGVKYGSFQCGAKGLIQLAQRTGAYAAMNAEAVNAEVYKGRNKVGEPIIDWEALDETKPVAGYVFAFEMINGFTKVCYWPKDKVERHASRYSQAYRGGYDSPWKDNFDRMAIKTVVANELRRWGMMSVELQGAFAEDHTIHRDIDAPAEYPEPGDEITGPKFDAPAKAEEKELADAGLAPQQSPAENPVQTQTEKVKRTRRAPVSASPQTTEAPAPAPAQTETATQPPPAPSAPVAGSLFSQPYNDLRNCMAQSQITDEELITLCRHRGVMTEQQDELLQLSDVTIADMVTNWTMVAGQIRQDRRKTQ